MHHSVTFALLSLGCSLGIGLVGCTASQQPENSTVANSSTSTTPAAGTSTTNTPGTTTNATSPTAAKPSQPAETATNTTTQAAARPPLTVEKLKNAEYYFLAKGPIQLAGGKYEDPATKRTYTMSDVVTYGDINKDGIKDAVTVLKVTIPNTGNFSYLVALINDAGNPKNISSEFMGPGIVPKSLKVKPDNSIEAVMDQYQAGDPECCPSLKITRTYKLKLNPTPSPSATESKK